MSDIRTEVIDAKDFNDRSFSYLTQNFYVMRSALRYYSQRLGTSFTSSDLAEDFPITVPVAASCLNVLKELEVVEARTKSSSPDRYMPETVDMDKIKEIGDILRENKEIKEFS